MFQGRELAPGATTDRGYTITFEQFEDSACTTAVGDFDGGLPISGPSATCIPNTNEGETAFGFYGYCDSTGAGGYEYVVSAAQCPPGEGSEGGECLCLALWLLALPTVLSLTVSARRWGTSFSC